MKNSKQIREQIGEILAKCKALHQLATEEDRDLSAEESQQFDAWIAEIGNDGADGQEKTGLHAKAAKAEKFEGILASHSKPINKIPGAQMAEAPGKVFAVPKRHIGRLKAFKGETAEEDAYKAGRWIAAALANHESSKRWCQENGVGIQAAMGGQANELGGFTVPTELENAIITLREQYGVFRRWADVVPMSSDTKNVPKYLSGLTAYAVGEADTITASDMALERVELISKKWGAIGRYSSELSEDSFVSWADRLADEMAYAFANKEDDCGFMGDGTSTYHGVQGIMNRATSGVHVYTAAAGNTSFVELDLADFEKCLGQLPQYAAMRRPAWFISRVGYYNSMSRLANAAGGNTNDDLGAGAGMNFLGLPVVITQVLNSTTTAQVNTNLLCVGDLSLGSMLGDRRGMALSVSEHVYWTTDEIGVRGTTRFAINNHAFSATAAGPIIILRTPGS